MKESEAAEEKCKPLLSDAFGVFLEDTKAFDDSFFLKGISASKVHLNEIHVWEKDDTIFGICCSITISGVRKKVPQHTGNLAEHNPIKKSIWWEAMTVLTRISLPKNDGIATRLSSVDFFWRLLRQAQRRFVIFETNSRIFTSSLFRIGDYSCDFMLGQLCWGTSFSELN